MVVLSPAPECKHYCHRVSIVLQPHHILKGSTVFWCKDMERGWWCYSQHPSASTSVNVSQLCCSFIISVSTRIFYTIS
ncbi:hypothetical protein J6590_035065 [Homalodisca vitripennis]|nr:hypothetical protein J6590_035065 [Homalodisca vitripennis]